MTKKYSLVVVWSCLLLALPSLSFAVEGSYLLGKEKLEFRGVVKASERTDQHKDWQEMRDIKGERFLVSNKAELTSEDIEGVHVQKDEFYGKEKYEVIVFFKEVSWSKVRDTTNRLLGKRLGVLRRNSILLAPIVGDTLEERAQLSPFSLQGVERFIAGFVRTNELPTEKKEREYFESLQRKVEKSLDDLDAAIELAAHYLHRKDYEKATSLFEKLIQWYPLRYGFRYNLGGTYVEAGKYDKAIEVFEKALVDLPDKEWRIRMGLAMVYKIKGENHNELRELEKSLKHLKASYMSEEGKKIRIEILETQIEEIKQAIK